MSVYQFTTKYSYGTAVQLRNTHHYEFPGYVPTAADILNAVDQIDAAYKARLQVHLSSLIDFSGYDYRRVDVSGMPTLFQLPTGGIWSGSNAGQLMPLQNAVIANWKGATAYPRNSRIYVAGWTEDANTPTGYVGPTYTTAVDNFASDLDVLTITAGADAVRVAVKYNKVPYYVSDYNTVLWFPTSSAWYIQRRRRPGVGI